MMVQKKSKRGMVVMAVLVIAVVLLSGVTAINYWQRSSTPKSQHTTSINDAVANLFAQMNVSLRIKILNQDGSLASTHNYPNDIITNQLIKYFTDTIAGGTAQCGAMNNLAGSATNMCDSSIASLYVTYSSVRPDTYEGGYIGIGTGSTAPTRSDYKLQTQVGSWAAVDTPVISGNSIIAAAGISLTSGATISEAGFAIESPMGGGTFADTSYMALIFHDTFTGFAVSAQQTVQVQYTLNLPSGSNENLIGYFASLMQNVGPAGNGATSYIVGTWVSEAGSTLSSSTYFRVSTNSCTSFLMCGSQGSSSYALPQIQVGTSNTAPSPGDYKLNAAVGSVSNTVTVTPDTTSYYNILFTNTITLTSATTVQEVGLFFGGDQTGVGGAASNYFLMLHNVITGVSIPANNAITTQFTVQF